MSLIVDKAKELKAAIDNVAASATDEIAVKSAILYEEWNGDSKTYKEGQRLNYSGSLYKVLQDHTSQDDWTPDLVTSLFSRIDEEHSGTKEDPIPYYANMEVFRGKYYTEDSVLYKCIRDSGIALQNKAADLVNNYFEVVE